MWVVKHRVWFYWLSVILIGLSLVSLFTFGLKKGTDFSGGTAIELSYTGERAPIGVVEAALGSYNSEGAVRPIGEKGYLIKIHQLSAEDEVTVRNALNAIPGTTINRISSVEPILGAESARKAIYSIVLVILGIVLFISFAFRHVSKPVSSWWYGFIAILALVHDVILPAGIWAALHYFFGGYEVDTLFVTALLVVLGFSVHDTIVVFDRVRENLKNNAGKSFAVTVGEGIRQTISRSINTSLTTVLALVALFIWGPEITRQFSLILIIGIVAGTYSSIFIGSPLLVTVQKWKEKREGNK